MTGTAAGFFLGTRETPVQNQGPWSEGKSLDYFQPLNIDQGAKVLEVFEMLLKDKEMPDLFDDSKDQQIVNKV